MPQTPDLSDIFGKPSPASSSSPDLSDIFGGKSTTSSASPSASTQPKNSDLSDIFGGGSQPSSSTSKAPAHAYQDPSKNWWERAWDWSNTPLTTSLFGLPEEREGAGGFERGVEHIISGLTSPLSVALGAATFGTGGLITSAGETALKEATIAGGEAAFSAADIAQIAKGSKAALTAYHSVPDIEPLIKGTLGVGGHDLGLLQKAREFFGPVSHDADLAKPEFQDILAKGGFDDAERKELARTGNAIKAVQESSDPVRQAVAKAGVDPDLWARGQKFLHDNKMDEAALLGGDLIDRGAFQILHHVAPDLSLGTTLTAARTAKTLMNTGFTLQQLEGAAAMSPRFFDALKEGDYDKAAEYGTEWAANAVLGVAGASHALHSWGELAEPVLGAKLKPSDEQLRVNRMAGVREAEQSVGDQEGINVYKNTIRALGYDPDKIFGMSKAEKAKLADDLERLHLTIESGKDAGFADAYRTTLRRIPGLEEETRPINGLPTGTPVTQEEIPPRANTKVVFSNANGEVRVGSDGRPVVWMSPEAWSEFETSVGHKIEGVSYAPDEAARVTRRMAFEHPTGDLFRAAQFASEKNLVTAVKSSAGILATSEELHHSWQRELSQNGDVEKHLDPQQQKRLYDIIPKGMSDHLDNYDYSQDPVVRVAETAAKFRAGRIPEGVAPEEVAKWLTEYEKEIEAKHGPGAYEPAERINEIAKQHLEDRDVREKRQVLRPTDLPDQQAGEGVDRRGSKGSGSDAGLGQEESGGVRGKTSEGLEAREKTQKNTTIAEGSGWLTDKGRWIPVMFGDHARVAAQENLAPKTTFSGGGRAYREQAVSNGNLRIESTPGELGIQVHDLPAQIKNVRNFLDRYVSRSENPHITIEDQDIFNSHNRNHPGKQGPIQAYGTKAAFRALNEALRIAEENAEEDRRYLEENGLYAREVEDEPTSFVSSNVYKLGNVAAAETRLNSRTQKISEKLSEDLGAHLGIKAVVRPVIGHWEGGAENSTISRFAPGTNPEKIEYYNAILSKVKRQNTGIHFIPDAEGPDTEFQFRVPSSVADPKTIARLLEEHRISGSSIEPIAGGHNVIITSPGGELRAPVSELANRLKATEVKEHNGTQTTLGDWNDRNAASTLYDARIRELEATHPEWRKIRSEFESSPDYNTLSKLVREAEDKVKSDKSASPFVTGVHGSRTANISELNPELQGKGPQGGAEMARAKNFPNDFVKRSYLNLEGAKGEPFYERLPYQYRAVLNSENLYNWTEDRDGLLPKAEKEAAVRKLDTQPGAVGTIYERMMRDNGYEGYYHPGHNQIGVFKNTPVEKTIAKGELGLFSRENPTWNDVKKHLTPEEIEKHDTPEKKESLLAAFKSMPSHNEWVAAIKAGKAGQMWYERSSRAFDALMDSGLDVFKPIDKNRFLNFTAALSPVQTVRSNLLMAVDLWSKWDKAGRPTDVEWNENGVPNKSAKLYKLMKRGVDLPARLNNAVRALQGEDLSGPKVSAFTQNLGDDTNRVTNDTWMAVFGDQDPNRIGKPAIYDAMSAHVREAAKTEKIEPRQAQAAVWSFIKTLAELSGWGHDRWIPPQEIIRQGLLTSDLIGKYSADFADLLSHDEEIRAKLTKVGGNLDQLDTNLKSYAPAKPATEGAVEGSPEHLLTAADRLEAARNNTRTQAHLARKQEGGLFDQNTDFNPQTVGTAAGAKADTDFFAQAKAELKTDDISAIARREQELKEAARPVNGLFSKERPVNGLPENLEEMLRDNQFSKKSPEYQKKILDAWDMIAEDRLPENIRKAYEYAKAEDGKNWELAHRNGMMEEFTDNHVHRKYLKNEQGNIVVSDAKAGKFATNTTGARRRSYDTLMTALLKSPDEIKFDPAEAISKDRAEVIKAAANRKFISQLMSSGLRASDGRPVAFLNGAGNVVAGENGKDPKTFVDPNRIRKINVDDKTIAHLTQSGDLQRFLDDGTIRDITPYVHPDNIGAAIDRLAKEALKSIDRNTYGEGGNNVLLSQIERLKEMQKTGDYSGLKELNDMQGKRYAWSPQGYVALDHNAMRGWNFVANSPDGNQVLVNTDVMAHPEYAEYLKNRLGLEKGALSKSTVGRAILSAGTAAKQTLLSLSPFHLVQIGLRGIMTGVNPFTLEGPDIENGAKIDPSDPNSPTKQRKMVEQGLTTGRDFQSMQEYTEGLSSGNHSLLRRVPVVGPILADSMQWQTDFLFKRFLPAIKATAAEKLFDDYQARYPEWSVDKVARAAGQHANDSFGGVNWKAMGRNATTQEFARAVLLAPDWLESELRSGARLFNKDEGAIGRRQVVIMAGSVYLLARALNALTTGNPHYEAPFDLATKSKDGKETLWGIRMLPSDLLHLASSPAQFVKGRLSPGVGLTQELLSGRDKMGRKMQPQDLWVDAVRQLMPIPVQSIGQAITNTGPAVGNVGQAWKALGGTARTYATPAQQKAVELAATHGSDGFVDPVQQARHRAVMGLEDRLRSGDIAWPDLVKMTYGTSQLTEAELKKIQNNIKSTTGMPADIAHLYSRASRLPAKEFLDVWDTANITEQKALQPLLLKTEKAYLRKTAKDLTPEQRQQDPTFQRLLKMATGASSASVSPQAQVTLPLPAPTAPVVSSAAEYPFTATHASTGHRIGSHDGKTWYDHATGEPLNA